MARWGAVRPSVWVMLWLAALPALSQSTPDAVWRCGHLITNQPLAGQSCQPITTLAPTVIEGTRVNGSVNTGVTPTPAPAVKPMARPMSPTAADSVPARPLARELLQAELKDHETRLQQLLGQWKQGQPTPMPEHAADAWAHQARVNALRQQLHRTEADIAALRRELARLP
jgi:hypothetical protein